MNRLTLYNMAIALVGGARINSTEIGASADICNDFIEVVAVSALESSDFTFARRQAVLSRRTTTEVDAGPVGVGSFTYSFNLPTDLIQIREVLNHEVGDWKVYSRILGSEQEEVTIDYTYAVLKIEEWPTKLAEAISYYLAYYIASGISGFDEARRDNLYQQYLFFRKQAIEADVGKEYYSIQGEPTLVEE